MNKDSWIALVIAGIITTLAATPLYYSCGPIGFKGRFSEGSGSKAIAPMKRASSSLPSTRIDE